MVDGKKHLKLLLEDKENGQIICGCGCGRVIESKKPDQGARILSDSDVGMSGTVSSLMKHDNNLTTIIEKVSGNSQFNRLVKVQNWVRVSNSREARLFRLIELILNVAGQLNLSKAIIEDACYLARKIQKGNRKKGFTQKTLACVLLFLASKRSFTPKSANIFSEILPNKRRLGFLAVALDIKDELKIDYEVRPKAKKKSKPVTTLAKKPASTECEYCGEQTTRKPITLIDGTVQNCCNFCEQRLRTRGIEFHREGTKTESELLSNDRRGLSLNNTEFLEFKNQKKTHMKKLGLKKFSDSDYLSILLKSYVEANK